MIKHEDWERERRDCYSIDWNNQMFFKKKKKKERILYYIYYNYITIATVKCIRIII